MLPVYPLTTEQINIQNLARDFAAREILPVVQLYETESLRHGNLLDKICQSGLANTRIPEEFGGLGLSLLETCLIAEELAFTCSGISSAVEASELAITYLLLAGTPEQKKEYLSMLTETNGLAGIALSKNYQTEKEAKLNAKQTKDSIFLNGYCPFVLNATFAKWFLITCPVTEISGKGGKDNDQPVQHASFIVPSNINGLEILEPVENIGRKAADLRSMRFTNVELKPISKLGDVRNSEFLKASDISLLVNGPIIASGCLGVAHAAFMHAKKYAQERQTFGLPIAKHQAIAFMMADMLTDIEGARMLTYAAIESTTSLNNNLKIAISNLTFALAMAARITNDAVQIFGGSGYTKDYPVEKLMRDAKAYQLFYGNSQTEYLAEALLQKT